MKSFFYKVALSIAIIGAVACSKSDIDSVNPEQHMSGSVAKQGEVRIAVPEGTRSSLVDNGSGGADLRWTSGDEIKLIARNEAGEDAFDPCVFYFWANTNVAGQSYFRAPSLYGDGNEAKEMPAGTYTYYAVSPSSVIVDGNNAKFSLSNVQNGEFSADVDFMVAKTTDIQLVACKGLDENENPIEETDPVNDLSLIFKHKTHILRFTIPESKNNLGQKIKKLHMIFPTAVAGTMSVNMDDGTIVSTENTSNKITVDFVEPKDAGDEFYVMILPQADVFSKKVDMRFEAVDGTTFSARHLVEFKQVCSENKLTPVKISVPAAVGTTSFFYTEGTNNLGEDLWSMNITLPEGYYFTNFEQTRKAKKGNDNKYIFSIFNDMLEVVENKTLSFAFESKSALIPQAVSIGDLTEGSENDLGVKNIPYLFAEDFSGIPDFSDGHDSPKVGTNSDTYKGIIELSAKSNNTLSGWYGTRIGGQKNTSVKICCRYENVLWVGAYYKGRIYTPRLTNIKDGKDVKISVSFSYGSNREERKPTIGSRPNKSAILYFGINTQDVVTNPDESEGDIIDSITGMVAGTGFASPTPTSLFPMVINGLGMSTANGSYTSFEGTKNVTIENVNSKMRLGWIVTTNNTSSNTNGNYWLFLDNIQVSIAK